MQSQAVEPSAESSAEEPKIPLKFGPSAYIINHAGFQIGTNHGKIIFSHHTETTLFESLAARDQPQGSIILERTTLSKSASIATALFYNATVEFGFWKADDKAEARLQTGRRVSSPTRLVAKPAL
jgi:hypothetical protein